MTIRKKILYSNILMLIIPVLIIASLGMIGVKKVGSRYWESLERMYEDGSGAVSVQSLIYSYQEGLKGIDWEQIEHEADSRVIVTDSGELKELQNELEGMGYHIRLYLDEIELYSNLTPGDEQTVEELMGDRIWTTDNLIAGQGSRALVKNSFEKDGETLTIMAVSSEGHPTERLDNTDFHYHLERRDLKEFLEEYGRSIREDLEKDQVDMRLELPQKPCMVLLDAGEFQRILDNAVSNSVKYREKPQTVMAVSLREDGKTAELRIRDDGPGVPDDCLERIFESFCRLDDARTKSGEGSGLGLAIVRQIVQGHGGQIHAENDHGLVLVITLPLDKREGDAHGEDSDRGR